MRALSSVGIVAFSFMAAAPAGHAQEAVLQQPCNWDVKTTPGTVTRRVPLGEGRFRLDMLGVEATCGVKFIKADSANYFLETGILYLMGRVRYRDPGRALDADRMTYYDAEDWARFEGNVELRDTASGSTLNGPVVHYYPQNQTRALERIFAPNRPHLVVRPESASPNDTSALEVDADRVHIIGSSVVAGAGRVESVRRSLRAHGDSMHLDRLGEQLWLFGSPRMEANEMVLAGDSILALLAGNQVREIQAWPGASARGRQLKLTAPHLRLLVEGDFIHRAIAAAGDPQRTGVVDTAGRSPWAYSESEEYALSADSLDILRPGGRLEQVHAVGRARAVGLSPVGPEDGLLGRDWLVGDTIIGFFEPPEDPEEAGEAELKRLTSMGNARALYHLREEARAQDTGTNHPAVNYVIGRIVSLWLQQGEVDQARVTGPSTGVYLEPVAGGLAADSLAPGPDSLTAVAADTTEVGRR